MIQDLSRAAFTGGGPEALPQGHRRFSTPPMVAGCPEPVSLLLILIELAGETCADGHVQRINHRADLHRDIVVLDVDID